VREFRKDVGRTSKPQVWKIWREGNKVSVQWGLLNGQMQSTAQVHKAVNVGKSNEKSPEVVAQEDMDRQVESQLKTGWAEVDSKTGKTISKQVSTTIDFMNLPENLRFWKPNSDITGHLRKKLESKDVIWTRKRDGMQHSVMKDAKGYWKMYSSTMAPAHKDEPEIPWLERYPGIHAALKRLNVPPRTILVGELVTGFDQDEDGFDVDSLQYVETIVKSKLEEAILKQQKGGWLSMCFFDIPFCGGDHWYKNMELTRRLGALHELVKAVTVEVDGEPVQDTHLGHVEMFLKGEIIHPNGRFKFNFDGTYEAAMELAKKKEWEGFVLLDPMGKFEDKGINFAGKAQRPIYASKVKPKLEADFIVYWDPDNKKGNGVHGTWGKGKKSNGVGAVFAYLLDKDTGVPRYITKVGGGLSDENVKKFADPNLYPMVWTVEFASWTDGGSIQFPEFIRVREDKSPQECTTEQMPADTTTTSEEE
jgi:hypothetical protein